jgi:hypothetical protein
MPADDFNPEMLQIRWVLGALRPEELPVQATLALQHGFDGTALRQLAGLVRPTVRDLESLPNRAFAEMGLSAIDKEQAATSLISRDLPRVSNTISVLLKSFPNLHERWKKHVVNWRGESAGSYNDIEEFVPFVIQDLYRGGNQAELSRFFTTLEDILSSSDPETRNLIASFFERLQNEAPPPHRGNVFKEFLGTRSREMWQKLQATWAC